YHYCYLLLHAPTTTEIYTLSLHDALPICLLFARQFAPLRECFTIYHHDTALMRTHIPCAPVLDARQFPTSVMTYGLSEHQRMEEPTQVLKTDVLLAFSIHIYAEMSGVAHRRGEEQFRVHEVRMQPQVPVRCLPQHCLLRTREMCGRMNQSRDTSTTNSVPPQQHERPIHVRPRPHQLRIRIHRRQQLRNPRHGPPPPTVTPPVLGLRHQLGHVPFPVGLRVLAAQDEPRLQLRQAP